MSPGVWALGAGVGTVAAALLIALGRRSSAVGERRFWASALLVAALIYVGFAAFGSSSVAAREHVHWLGIEGLGVIVYGALAALGMRRPRALAAGWALHVLWDLGHRHASWVPDWYVAACLAFDVVVAGYLGLGAPWRRRAPRERGIARPGVDESMPHCGD